MLSCYFLDFTVGVGAFLIGLSQVRSLSFFFASATVYTQQKF